MDFSYSTLPSTNVTTTPSTRRSSKFISAVATSFLLLALVALVVKPPTSMRRSPAVEPEIPTSVPSTSYVSRGVREGVSEKSSGVYWTAKDSGRPSWTNDMLRWQRSTFHFQPEKNWMNGHDLVLLRFYTFFRFGDFAICILNLLFFFFLILGHGLDFAGGWFGSSPSDPNGPLHYKGWYHLFYQYNPDSAIWGNITWGHAVSRDLIHWFHLPLAMVTDRWYDVNGVWSGSATFLPDGRVVMLYTGSTNASAQVQNLAVPANLSDPLLLKWRKSDANPILFAPPGIKSTDFRDPTTAWYVPHESAWRIAIGSKDAEHTGLALVYRTKDFVNYEILPGDMHAVPGTGMWECIDFYPVATTGRNGLDTSINDPTVKHVLKASLDDDKHDYYAIGSYDVEANTWTPDDPENDVGIGLRLDYGKYYASKSFYDPTKQRRVLWGWTGETDSEMTDIQKGWASLQTIPRTVTFDQKTKSNLLLWPVDEVENLRLSGKNFTDIQVAAGSVVPLDVGHASQLDITAEFEVEKEALEATAPEADVGYNCSTSGGAAGRGAFGPFGLLVLSDEKLSEQTAVYFYIARRVDGKLDTFICQDELRSSMANDLVKRVYGSAVPVLDGEKLSVRILVDHSVVETFAQGGRTCITSRVYPTRAIFGAARLFLFNNATGAHVTTTSLKVWEMNSAFIRPFDFDKDYKNQTAT